MCIVYCSIPQATFCKFGTRYYHKCNRYTLWLSWNIKSIFLHQWFAYFGKKRHSKMRSTVTSVTVHSVLSTESCVVTLCLRPHCTYLCKSVLILFSTCAVMLCVKATECGKGGIHRSQPWSSGQSEETTAVDRPSQVTEDHQDTGTVYIHSLQKLYFVQNCV